MVTADLPLRCDLAFPHRYAVGGYTDGQAFTSWPVALSLAVTMSPCRLIEPG